MAFRAAGLSCDPHGKDSLQFINVEISIIRKALNNLCMTSRPAFFQGDVVDQQSANTLSSANEA